MAETKDGGPAFPRDERFLGHNGMSLRDWFAAHAPEMPSKWYGLRPAGEPVMASMAAWRFAFADAMLAARETAP